MSTMAEALEQGSMADFGGTEEFPFINTLADSHNDRVDANNYVWDISPMDESQRQYWGVPYIEQVKERVKSIMESRDDKINPPHYKNVAAGKQYMELMVDMLENKEGVEAHLFGQVYKYLMRCGNKDEEVQELKKAQWYLNALIKFKTEGVVM